MQIAQVKFMLRAKEMWRAVAFWRDVFELQVRFGDDEWTELVVGDSVIALHTRLEDTQFRAGLSIEVTDIEAAVAAVRAAGGNVISQPHHPKGQTFLIASVADTEGNRFRLTQGA